MELISGLILLVGLIFGYAIAHFKSKSESSRLEERNDNLKDKLEAAESELAEKSRKANELDKELAARNADYRNLQERLNEQKKELAEMQEQLTTQFENLANKILEEKIRNSPSKTRSRSTNC